jgi:hypothetical protein
MSGTSILALCKQLNISDRRLKTAERQLDDGAFTSLDQDQTAKREEIIKAIKDKIVGLGHKGRCGIWIGSRAEELLEDVHFVEDIEILRELLDYERARQHALNPHERNKAMIRELKRRLRVELVVTSPMVQKVRALLSAGS